MGPPAQVDPTAPPVGEAPMTRTLTWDVETDGFLDQLTRIFSLVVHDSATDTLHSYADQPGYAPIAEGLAMLEEGVRSGATLVAHNGIPFDVEAVRKVTGINLLRPGQFFDTLAAVRAMWPDLGDSDIRLIQRRVLPKELWRSHSLEAWGYRLGTLKDTYSGGFEAWSKTMQEYCEQDVRVTLALHRHIRANQTHKGHTFADASLELEHDVLRIVTRQMLNGFGFDTAAGAQLYGKLSARREELRGELVRAFPLRVVPGPLVEKPPRKGKPNKGGDYMKLAYEEFNPASRIQAASRLAAKYGWQPGEFTGSGQAKIDETILSLLPYPEARLLAEFYVVGKLIGQLAEGDQAWLKAVRNGRIHGSVNTNGAVTGRMTHSSPNLAQVPASGAPFGAECRALFRPTRPGWVQVGCDADGLEGRLLAHFTALFDGGALAQIILEGKKEDGTDLHSRNAATWGRWLHRLGPKLARDRAKTGFYALIYGAADWKLATSLGVVGSNSTVVRHGKGIRAAVMRDLPAFAKLTEVVKKTAEKRGYLIGLDGRWLWVRKAHAALNTLLQSAGAIVMKKALVILDNRLQEAGLVPGKHYEFLGNIHDEWQIESHPDHAEQIGRAAAAAIAEAGAFYQLKCPLVGNYVIGQNWRETH